MKRFLLIILTLIFALKASAQKEDYTWYFGAGGSGLNFDSCGISILYNGSMGFGTFEGTSAISDEQTGQLLFYTNGLNVYSANHVLMQNGYQAGLSTSITQNIIIRKPGSNTIFYLFTADVQGGISSNPTFPAAIGINYAVIDMSQDGGLGSVVSKFNILKDTSNSEKLTAVRHSNGQDIWLIGHEYGNNRFFVYSITTAGIDTVPQYFSVGPDVITYQPGIPAYSRYDAIGELKASPDGNKLAFTTYYNGYTALFNFDKSTGTISNPIQIDIDGSGYGLSFSPNNELLYLGRMDTNTVGGLPDTSELLQFDISSWDSAAIQNSMQIIYSCQDCGFASMKIAPIRKIIVAHYGYYSNFVGDPFLGIIHFPDSAGAGCSYDHQGVSLNNQASSWGLNNLMENPHYCVTTGQQDIEKNTTNIYPNPFTDFITIAGLTDTELQFKLYTLTGSVVMERVFNTGNGESIHIPGLQLLPSGMYFAETTTKTNYRTYKLIKQ